jgi:hypothetical protein
MFWALDGPLPHRPRTTRAGGCSASTSLRQAPEAHIEECAEAVSQAETKARYAFVYGDFRRLHRTGLIACVYRAAEWRHKDIELAAHDLLQVLDRSSR